MTLARHWIAGCAMAALCGIGLSSASAQAADKAMETAIHKAVSPEAQPWLSDQTIVGAVKAQDAKHAGITQAKIDEMDNQWKAAAKAKSANPAFETIASSATSKHLKEIVAKSKGQIVEILLMDDHGLNVAQTDGTSDYWQGDEPKWQKVFTGGSTVYMTEPEKGDDGKTMVSEVSVPVTDPATRKTIGVAMIVLDTNKLGH